MWLNFNGRWWWVEADLIISLVLDYLVKHGIITEDAVILQ